MDHRAMTFVDDDPQDGIDGTSNNVTEPYVVYLHLPLGTMPTALAQRQNRAVGKPTAERSATLT